MARYYSGAAGRARYHCIMGKAAGPEVLSRRYVSAGDPRVALFRGTPGLPARSRRRELAFKVFAGALTGIAVALMPKWGFVWLQALEAGILTACLYLLFLPARTQISRSQYRQLLGEDEAALGEPRPNERYVGVSYSSALVFVGQDSSWDRGWLRWEGACLCIRGHGPAFSLPAALICNADVAWSERSSLPRIVVNWQHPDGTDERIVLEVRTARTDREQRTECQSLMNWINAGVPLRKEPCMATDSGPLPCRSTDFDTAPRLHLRDLIA